MLSLTYNYNKPPNVHKQTKVNHPKIKVSLKSLKVLLKQKLGSGSLKSFMNSGKEIKHRLLYKNTSSVLAYGNILHNDSM
jgi:hypothetical protein